MLVETKYLGEMNIDETKIIHFASGLPGFIDETKFAILDIPGNELLQILQSTVTPNLAFFVTNPYYFYEEYTFKLDDHIVEALKVKNEKEVVILSIMTIKEPFSSSTINLKAPIIINSAEKKGKQFILNDDTYTMQASISLPTSEERGD